MVSSTWPRLPPSPSATSILVVEVLFFLYVVIPEVRADEIRLDELVVDVLGGGDRLILLDLHGLGHIRLPAAARGLAPAGVWSTSNPDRSTYCGKAVRSR